MPNKSFTSLYPIIAMAMNQVSDIKFAMACAKAGIIPSVSVVNYYTESYAVDYTKLVDDLIFRSRFQRTKSTKDIIFSLYEPQVYDRNLIKILNTANIKVLEIIMPWHEYDKDKFRDALGFLANEGFVLFQRAIQYDPSIKRPARNGYWFPCFDGIIAKGSKGAGAVTEQSLEEMFTTIQRDFPDKMIIVAGGISTKEQVASYINRGAIAVGIGTMFAASAESCLSGSAKQRLIDADFEQVQQNTIPEKNALVFKHLHTKDPNHTVSLKIGINRPDLGGHIYAGEGINNIKAIRPLKDIVADLV